MFKGDVPQDVVEEARKVPAPVDFEGRKGYSDNEVRAEVEKVAAGFKDKSGTRAVSADPFTGEVQMNADAAVKDHDDWLRGGGYLDKDLNSQRTSGFNIEKGGVYSPMTAGHCVPVGFVDTYFMTYQLHGGDGGSTTPVYSKLRHVGSYGESHRHLLRELEHQAIRHPRHPSGVVDVKRAGLEGNEVRVSTVLVQDLETADVLFGPASAAWEATDAGRISGADADRRLGDLGCETTQSTVLSAVTCIAASGRRP